MSTRGYTLLELLVSIGLFSIVMMLTTGALLKLISLDRQARGTNDVVTNLSFALDSMARAVRTGYDYSCGTSLEQGDCWSLGGNSLSFIDENGRQISYLVRTDGTIGRCAFPAGTTDTCTSGNSVSMTDPRVQVSGLVFHVRGTARGATGDQVQPQVLYHIHGTMRPDPQSDAIDFHIQTSATQRLIDL